MRDSTRARLHGIKLGFKNLWREIRGRSTDNDSSTVVYMGTPSPVLASSPVVYDSTYLLQQQMARYGEPIVWYRPMVSPSVDPSTMEPWKREPAAISPELSAVEMQNPQVIEPQSQDPSMIDAQAWDNIDPSAVNAQNSSPVLPPRSTIVDLHRPPVIDPVQEQVSTTTWHSSAEIPPAPAVPPYLQMPPAPVVAQPSPVLSDVQPGVGNDPASVASLPEMSGVALPELSGVALSRTANYRLFDRIPPVGPASPSVDPAAVSEQRYSR